MDCYPVDCYALCLVLFQVHINPVRNIILSDVHLNMGFFLPEFYNLPVLASPV